MTRAAILAAFLAAFLGLQVVDVLTTQHVLAAGGWEGNLLMAGVMSALGGHWWIAKLGVMALCALAMARWPVKRVLPFVALMAVVVANNAYWALQ